ncbi:hypothetical protein LOZ53_003834 [Ophidiomyces ophidiicola]|nr:hypothetical protein LOZ55_002661 [Ophidiomyces ophidiicola]KAI1985604.1 hypothetical protein LOZ54_004153 [Ophidiomyces ophidiicola]KAI1988751.1 hypothetical protein LOZ53_003834 [Ophidiomyces ophidiicola]KAI2003198.1 hypothetical protein LOZ51_000272 [Ophidiomyces ophidiicola]
MSSTTEQPQNSKAAQFSVLGDDKMSFWKSYRNLSPRTRMIFGFGLMGYAAFGLWSESRVEKTLGMVPSEAEKEELDKHISVKIHSVDKAD